MTIDNAIVRLEQLSAAGIDLENVKFEITALEFLQAIKDIAASAKKPQTQFISLKEAAAAYQRDRGTILRWVQGGVLLGNKAGGAWYIESPQSRYERLNNNNN